MHITAPTAYEYYIDRPSAAIDIMYERFFFFYIFLPLNLIVAPGDFQEDLVHRSARKEFVEIEESFRGVQVDTLGGG